MAFPFPVDRITSARLNWCRPGDVDDTDPLSCVLRARMCNAHIRATGNAAWHASASPVLADVLAAPSVHTWTACPEAAASGTCGLLMADRYAPALWQALGHAREQDQYAQVLTGAPSGAPPEPALAPLLCATNA